MGCNSTSANDKIDLYQIYSSIMKEESEEHKKNLDVFCSK